MEIKERAKKDIDKLEHMLEIFKREGYTKKYPKILDYVKNYFDDAQHFYDKQDYFSSFGAANYAYGFIDCILILEGKKDETNTL